MRLIGMKSTELRHTEPSPSVAATMQWPAGRGDAVHLLLLIERTGARHDSPSSNGIDHGSLENPGPTKRDRN